MFKALANPQRLRIFLRLASCCAPSCCSGDAAKVRRCAGEVGADLGLAASTVSHHLKELRQAGLMRIQRRGQKVECWLAAEALDALRSFFGDAFAACCAPGESSGAGPGRRRTSTPAARGARAGRPAAGAGR